jgi:ATP-dependent Lon protease
MPPKRKITRMDAETDTSDLYDKNILNIINPLMERMAENKIASTITILADAFAPQAKRKKRIIEDTDSEDSEEEDSEFIEMDEDEIDPEEQEYLESLTEEKRKELKDMEEKIKEFNQDGDKPVKYQILEMPIDIKTKYNALAKYEQLEMIDPNSSEYAKIYKWMDTFLKIPFGKYISLPVQEGKNTIPEINNYLQSVKSELDQCVFGNTEPKEIIQEILAQWVSNPASTAVVIGLEGPAGTGKTSLARHGIANALKRSFFQINLGGMSEGMSLGGSNIVYEGSTYGQIVQILMDAQVMNPVIYFDELDKVSKSNTGREVIGLLTHLTDYTQNMAFRDKYLDVDLDLSKALFIFSYNEPENLDPILKDRMKIIKMPGYNQDEKLVITRDYVIPAVVKNVGKDIIIYPDEMVKYLIRTYSPEVSGIRDIKRIIEKIAMKINYLRFADPDLIYKHTMDGKIMLNMELIKLAMSSINRIKSMEFNSMYL